MILSVIIPTKNRPNDLLFAVKSIVDQIRLPDQIVIIDQSETAESENNIKSNIEFPDSVELIYVHDTSIKGLVEAKAKSLTHSKGELICFFEDDIVLENNYLFEIEKTFKQNEHILGCSGVITNATSGSWLYRFFYRITHVGIFKDERPDIFFKLSTQSGILLCTNSINGGLSAWRKAVFSKVPFDYFNKFHMMEDFEFSYRANRIFPSSLFINSDARLEHNFSPINRNKKTMATQRKVFEYLVFFKKNKEKSLDYFSLFILFIGLAAQILILTIVEFRFSYLFAFFKGLNEGLAHNLVSPHNNAK
jgi:glycosyltransferase involved in cell wall biosynthesis